MISKHFRPGFMKNYFRNPVGVVRRWFVALPDASNVFNESILSSCKGLDELGCIFERSRVVTVKFETAMRIIHKFTGKGKSRKAALVPRSVARVICSSVASPYSALTPSNLVNIIHWAGLCPDSVDEYLMYVMARSVVERVVDFSSAQLADILHTFGKLDICDEQLIEKIISEVLLRDASVRVTFTELVRVLHALSKLSYRHDGFVARIKEEISSTSLSHRLSVKDVSTCLSSLASLDYGNFVELSDKLWQPLSEGSLKYLSHDEQSELVVATVLLPHAIPALGLAQSLISKANREKRMRSRVRVLIAAAETGVVPYVLDKPNWRKSGGETDFGTRETCKENFFLPGSGLQMDVTETLDRMCVKFKQEVKVGDTFAVDIVIGSV